MSRFVDDLALEILDVSLGDADLFLGTSRQFQNGRGIKFDANGRSYWLFSPSLLDEIKAHPLATKHATVAIQVNSARFLGVPIYDLDGPDFTAQRALALAAMRKAMDVVPYP